MIGIRGAVGLLALSLCGIGVPSVRASGASQADAPPASAMAGAGVGDTIELAGMDQGEQIAATVERVVDPARPATEFDHPDSGQRLVAVQLKLVNTGSTVYSDSPDNGAILVDRSGESFNSDLSSTSAGASFPGSVNISPGSKRLGFVVFEVPKSSAIDTFQFTLDSGFADQTGEWSVRGAARTQQSDPASVVRSYYDAINNRDFKTAWDLGGKNFGQSYEDFVAGFDQTANDTLTIVSTSGNAVRVKLDAEQTDGSHKRYAGTYFVSGGELTSADMHRV
jgi:hypothetical protein